MASWASSAMWHWLLSQGTSIASARSCGNEIKSGRGDLGNTHRRACSRHSQQKSRLAGWTDQHRSDNALEPKPGKSRLDDRGTPKSHRLSSKKPKSPIGCPNFRQPDSKIGGFPAGTSYASAHNNCQKGRTLQRCAEAAKLIQALISVCFPI